MFAAFLGFFIALALITVRVPIATAMGAVGFVGFGILVGWEQAATLVGIVSKDVTMNYAITVIPLFILMGNFVAGAGISTELYRVAQAFLGARRGGLAYATVVACGAFASICGSSVATVVTMGKVALPAMRQYKYADSLSTAAIAGGATLGIMIPPSIILIIYGVITETHIGKLYAAALIPGLLGILGYMGAVYWTVWRRPESAPPAERAPWSERVLALKGVWAAITLFVVVIGGLYAGIFTATEAAAAGAFGGFIFALAKHKLTWLKLYSILFDSAKTTAILMALVLGSGVFTEFLNVSGAHAGLMDTVKQSGLSPGQVITVICLLYVVLGALMEELSMVLLTVPLLFPVVVGLGYDPVWFGILVTVLCELGLIAPPVGMNLFVMQTVAPNVGMKDILRGIVPFIASDLGRVAVIAAFPALSLFLPKLLFS